MHRVVSRGPRGLAVGVASLGLLLGSVSAGSHALANESKPGLNSPAASTGKTKTANRVQSRLPRTADGYPDLSRTSLKPYAMKGTSLKVVPVNPNSQVITQDYFVIAKGFTGPVKVRVDGWELSMTEFDFKYHPEDYELGKAAVQEFVVPGDGKHRITVTHPYGLLCVMIHAKAGDKKGRTAGARFEVNAVYDSVEQQRDFEEADRIAEETGVPGSHRPSVRPYRPPNPPQFNES
jgi:hypothetical protein